MTNSRMREGRIPTHKEIGEKKARQVLTKFKGQKTFARAIEIMGESWKSEIALQKAEDIRKAHCIPGQKRFS